MDRRAITIFAQFLIILGVFLQSVIVFLQNY